jgi:hypothetical protein
VDGKSVLATGDQYEGGDGMGINYVFPGRYRVGDYTVSAELYRSLRPDIILPGHWPPLYPTAEYFEQIAARDRELEGWLRQLLPAELPGYGAEGYGARLEPYLATVSRGEAVEFLAEVHNPFEEAGEAEIRLVAPVGWRVVPERISVVLPPAGQATLRARVLPPAGVVARRARVGLDLTVNGRRLGQQAEALVTVM